MRESEITSTPTKRKCEHIPQGANVLRKINAGHFSITLRNPEVKDSNKQRNKMSIYASDGLRTEYFSNQR